MIPERLLLCFHTADAQQLRPALDYWSGHRQGDRWIWDESTAAIASRHELRPNKLSAVVVNAVTACDPQVRCVGCGVPRTFSSRAAVTSSLAEEYLCCQCFEARQRERYERLLEDQRKAEEEKRAVLQALVSVPLEPVDYENLAYFDAVLLYTILLASDEACNMGVLSDVSRLHLCSTAECSSNQISGLYKRGILGFGSATPSEAIEVHGPDKFTYFPNRVSWRIACDIRGCPTHKIFGTVSSLIDLRNRHPEYEEAVAKLWWLLAYDDAIHTLSQEVRRYRMNEYRHGPKTELALKRALTKFSIPRVRRIIQNVVKNAAALSTTREFNRQHALNTIPGGIDRYVDRAVSDGWNVYPVLLNWANEEPILQTVLFDRVLGNGHAGFIGTTGSTFGSVAMLV